MNIQKAFSYNLDSLSVKKLMVNINNIYIHVEDFNVRFLERLREYIQSTPDDSNLPGKSKKVRVIEDKIV